MSKLIAALISSSLLLAGINAYADDTAMKKETMANSTAMADTQKSTMKKGKHRKSKMHKHSKKKAEMSK